MSALTKDEKDVHSVASLKWKLLNFTGFGLSMSSYVYTATSSNMT